MAEEFFDGLEFGFGHVQIFLRVFRVLFLHVVLRFGKVCLHALLGRDDVSAKAVAGGSLLALQIIQRLRRGRGAAVEVIVFLLDFLGLRSRIGLGLGSLRVICAGDGRLSVVLRLRS